MTMLDILKERLPEGLKIEKVKDRAGRNHIEIVFSYEGTEVVGRLNKTCAPGHETNICDITINCAMMSVALTKGDLEMGKLWLEKDRARIERNGI